MDTHIHPDPGSTESGPFHVSLPEDVLDRERVHPDGEASETAQAPTASPEEQLSPAEQPARRNRGLLLGTAVCVLVLGAGAAYLFSAYNTVYPVPLMASALRHLADEAGIGQPSVLAPSAKLARVDAPPLPPPGLRAPYTPVPRKSEVDEIIALRAGAPGPGPAPAPGPAPPARSAAQADNPAPAFLPGEPGGPAIPSSPASASASGKQQSVAVAKADRPDPAHAAKPDLTQSIVAGMHDRDATSQVALADVQVTPQSPPRPIPAPSAEPQRPASATPSAPLQAEAQPAAVPATPSPLDAATAASSLQAAPMSTPDQVQVLELVTRLGTLLADQRKEVDQLREDLVRTRTDDTVRIDDFQRRLTFAEAQRALAKASGAAAEPAPGPPAVLASEPATSVLRPALVVARVALPAGTGQQPAQRYRVQAASPGLAMLAAIDRAGDESAQLQVALGETVPGYGRVKAVVQQGTTWVVKTERGTIGQ